MPFGQRRQFQQLLLGPLVLVHVRHLEVALRDRTGLVQHDDFDVGQRLHKIGALDQNALPAGRAKSAKERQRNTHDDRAGAADDQECERSVDPLGDGLHGGVGDPGQNTDRRPQDRQRQRAVADGRRIYSREFCDELLRSCLVIAGALHQIQDLGGRGLLKFLRRLHPQNARHIDRSAQQLIALLHVSGQALSGQR